jgi:hypothetical protein
MTLQLVQSEDFLLDLEGQFHWYIHESKLDVVEAVALAQEFKVAVLNTLDFLLKNPGSGSETISSICRLGGHALLADKCAIQPLSDLLSRRK